jgi:hypothetical protein
MKSEGNLGAGALAEANNAWWSATAWQDRRLMRAYAIECVLQRICSFGKPSLCHPERSHANNEAELDIG